MRKWAWSALPLSFIGYFLPAAFPFSAALGKIAVSFSFPYSRSNSFRLGSSSSRTNYIIHLINRRNLISFRLIPHSSFSWPVYFHPFIILFIWRSWEFLWAPQFVPVFSPASFVLSSASHSHHFEISFISPPPFPSGRILHSLSGFVYLHFHISFCAARCDSRFSCSSA